MLLSKKELKKIYKDNFDEKQYQPNGIDLCLVNVQVPVPDKYDMLGIDSDGNKMIPKLQDFPMFDVENDEWCLYPGCSYYINCGHMDIPAGFAQLYKLRSTFMRCGCTLVSSVGDSGYSGDLIFKLSVDSDIEAVPVKISKGERVVQAVMFELNDAESSYDGDYQNNEIYNK